MPRRRARCRTMCARARFGDFASRMNADGVVRIVSSEHRSQLRNREAAEERLVKLVRAALTVPRTRRKTAPTRASKEARLESKKRRSEIKKRRARDDFE